MSACRLDFGKSDDLSSFRLGFPSCFFLVVQSEFRGHFIHELCCLYFSPQIMQDLGQSERRHLVTLIKVNMHFLKCTHSKMQHAFK